MATYYSYDSGTTTTWNNNTWMNTNWSQNYMDCVEQKVDSGWDPEENEK